MLPLSRSSSRYGFLAVLLILMSAAVGNSPAFAANSGLDTPTGVTSLPFGVEGNEVMNLTTSGLSIGTATAPQGELDVYGGMHLGMGTAPAVSGHACTVEGVIAYDYTNHQIVYCSNTLVWESPSGVPVSRTWHNVTSQRAAGHVYTNNYSYPIEVTASSSGAVCTMSLAVNGAEVDAMGCSQGCDANIYGTVPPNATYAITVGYCGPSVWSELY